MGIFHFLNVRNGDCSIIQHPSGHITVIDVYNAKTVQETVLATVLRDMQLQESYKAVAGNFNQKAHPVNPIEYLRDHGISSVFRFILTHPDMDHMGGIADFFAEFFPTNFWDTANICEKDFDDVAPYNEGDWNFYLSLRDGEGKSPKRLTLYSGAQGQYYNRTEEDGSGGGDGLFVLSPTKELIDNANECDDYNDSSYVILYRSKAGRILVCGDSHDLTWEHILQNHAAAVANVDLLIAPHHGRDSHRNYDFLDVVNPALTFFGNAKSEHLAYAAWYNRNLPVVTNNQANCMVVDTNTDKMSLYVTNKSFAEKVYPQTWYSNQHRGWYVTDFGH